MKSYAVPIYGKNQATVKKLNKRKKTFHETFYQQYGPSVFLLKLGQEELSMERLKRTAQWAENAWEEISRSAAKKLIGGYWCRQ